MGPCLTQALCVLPLSYMVGMVYFSMFRMKISGWYGLYSDHHTDTASLLWCASVLARLTAPLCYHFIRLIDVRRTSFETFYGDMDVVPVVGNSLNQVFPCFIAVLCMLNLLNVFPKFLECLGLGGVEFDWAMVADGPSMSSWQP